MAEGHNFRSSGYERRKNEQYFTMPWCTEALARHIPEYVKQKQVWEPAAGRGDITKVLEDHGYDVMNSDLDTTNWDWDLGQIKAVNFLEVEPCAPELRGFNSIITNPPYGKQTNPDGSKGTSLVSYNGKKMTLAEAFIRHSFVHGVEFVAMLLPTDFNHSSKRRDLFEPDPDYDPIFCDPKLPFAFEIVLTSRPRWDWWYEPEPGEKRKSPMHNYSWFVWDQRHEGVSTQKWAGPKDVGEPETEEDDDENV
jgi:hypothetical protein